MRLFILFASFVLFCFLNVFSVNAKDKGISSTPIQNFDLSKYLGKWYEIARTDNRFEKNCKNVTANYSLRDDGGVNVLNTCSTKNKDKTAKARAYFKKSQNIGSLKVTFFWPFYGDYNIVFVDKDYQYAIVDGGSKKYLWILSRTKTIDKKILDNLLDISKKNGFDIQSLIHTEHTN